MWGRRRRGVTALQRAPAWCWPRAISPTAPSSTPLHGRAGIARGGRQPHGHGRRPAPGRGAGRAHRQRRPRARPGDPLHRPRQRDLRAAPAALALAGHADGLVAGPSARGAAAPADDEVPDHGAGALERCSRPAPRGEPARRAPAMVRPLGLAARRPAGQAGLHRAGPRPRATLRAWPHFISTAPASPAPTSTTTAATGPTCSPRRERGRAGGAAGHGRERPGRSVAERSLGEDTWCWARCARCSCTARAG